MTQAQACDALLAEETELVLPQFTFEDGHTLAGRAMTYGRANGLALVAEVFAYAQVIAQLALPGTAPDNGHWIRRKRNTVLRTGHSSLYLGQLAETQDIDVFADFALDRADYALHGGSIPLRLATGGLIGAFTISGLPHLQDHQLAVDLLSDFINS